MSGRSLPFGAVTALLLALLCGCGEDAPPQISAEDPPPYDFARPDTIFQLPIELSEISGLAVADSNLLVSIQDEDGVLYFIDASSGQVVRSVPFGSPGDYEGIERVGESLVVMRSDGVFFRVTGWRPEGIIKSERTERLISQRCNAEGLTLGASGGELIIACKNNLSGGGDRYIRAVFTVPTSLETPAGLPLFSLDARTINEHPNYDSGIDRRLRAILAPVIDLSGFTPSGIAVHPDTGLLYMLSSTQRTILILDESGVIVDLYHLHERFFPQPEGIAFLPDGTLFISSEGPLGRATLVRYRPNRPS